MLFWNLETSFAEIPFIIRLNGQPLAECPGEFIPVDVNMIIILFQILYLEYFRNKVDQEVI